MVTEVEFRTFLLTILNDLEGRLLLDLSLYRGDPIGHHARILQMSIGLGVARGFERFRDFIDQDVYRNLQGFPPTIQLPIGATTNSTSTLTDRAR